MTTFQYHGESDAHFAARRALAEAGVTWHALGDGFHVNAPSARYQMSAAEVLAWLEGQR
jgi:hypothetical protein